MADLWDLLVDPEELRMAARKEQRLRIAAQREAGAARRLLRCVIPNCVNLHHEKIDLHKSHEPCPVEERIVAWRKGAVNG